MVQIVDNEYGIQWVLSIVIMQVYLELKVVEKL